MTGVGGEAGDPRFADAAQIAADTAAGVEILREAIAQRTLAEWAKKFATLKGPWAPAQDSYQVGQDDQIRSTEYILPAGAAAIRPNEPAARAAAPRVDRLFIKAFFRGKDESLKFCTTPAGRARI